VSHEVQLMDLDADMTTEEARPIVIPVERVAVADGPFVLADPKEMNIPVFSKPIVAPKMILSQFPKVGLRCRRSQRS